MANLRPLLLPSKLDDAPQKVGFSDDKWFMVGGGQGIAEVSPEAVYLVMALRNAGNGIAVLHGWHLYPERQLGAEMQPTPVDGFTRLTRDLYVPVGDVGFWQGAFRDPSEPEFAQAAAAIRARQPMSSRPALRRQRGRAARNQPVHASPRAGRKAGTCQRVATGTSTATIRARRATQREKQARRRARPARRAPRRARARQAGRRRGRRAARARAAARAPPPRGSRARGPAAAVDRPPVAATVYRAPTASSRLHAHAATATSSTRVEKPRAPASAARTATAASAGARSRRSTPSRSPGGRTFLRR